MTRIQLSFINEVENLRKSGFIPSREKIESDAKSILESSEVDRELKKYKDSLIQYENELKKV